MQSLLFMLNGIYPMPNELQNHLFSILQHQRIKKGEFLLKCGQICKKICFIEKGLLHSYQQGENRKLTSWLMSENNVIISVKSFFLQIPSSETIEALEDCELYFITFEQLQQTCRDHLVFNIHRATLTQSYYILENDHRLIMQNGNTIERLQWFVKSFPGFLGRVPARYIASFMGMREETLSRIKAQFRL